MIITIFSAYILFAKECIEIFDIFLYFIITLLHFNIVKNIIKTLNKLRENVLLNYT